MRPHRLATIARTVAVIAIALQSLAGMCGDNCGEPGVAVADASVAAGVMHARTGQQEVDLPVTNGGNEPSTCTLWATLGSSTPDDGNGGKGAVSFLFDDPNASIVTGYFRVTVHDAGTNDYFDVSISTSDPRGWSSLGEVPATDVAASVRVTSWERCKDNGDCDSLCEADVPEASVRFVVEESAGAADDSQNRVSDDFQRKLTLELDLGGPIVPLERDIGDACEDVELSGSVTFSWSSDDFVWTDCPA